MSDQQHDLRAISREWMAARIVLIVGFVLALAAGGYFAWQARQKVMESRQEALANVKEEQAQENKAVANDQAGEQLCKTALADAQNYGIIPPYGQLTAYTPKESDVKGRYVCAAATGAAKYVIAADLACRNLKSANCVLLYSVVESNGTVLYKRRT